MYFIGVATLFFAASTGVTYALPAVNTTSNDVTIQPRFRNCNRDELFALAVYEVDCGGGQVAPGCYKGGDKGCRCDSFGTYLC